VTVKSLFFGVAVVELMDVGEVVSARVVTSVSGGVVELRVCGGIVIVEELLCGEVGV